MDGRKVNRPYDPFFHHINTPMQLNILPVGTGVLDGPESNKFCFLNGYQS